MPDISLRPAIGQTAPPAFESIATDDVQGQIGLRLRALYEEIVSDPVPDRFRTLLESLDCSN